MNSRRPEHALPASELYSTNAAYRYARSSRLSNVQTELAERCVQLLTLPDGPSYLLDIGCGTGFSASVLNAAGHVVVGTDLSRPMLEEAAEDEDVEADLLQSDAGDGVPFRMGTFDGAVSVSAIQWLCNGDTSAQNPYRRLRAFFSSLYACLRRSARAALQFYPENQAQIDLISAAAMRAGFSGGLLVDYPNSARAKKYYLVLTAGPPNAGTAQPVPLGVPQTQVAVAGRRQIGKSRKNKANQLSRRELVIAKKDRRRRQGHETKPDSKFSGRKRRIKF